MAGVRRFTHFPYIETYTIRCFHVLMFQSPVRSICLTGSQPATSPGGSYLDPSLHQIGWYFQCHSLVTVMWLRSCNFTSNLYYVILLVHARSVYEPKSVWCLFWSQIQWFLGQATSNMVSVLIKPLITRFFMSTNKSDRIRAGSWTTQFLY